MTQELEALIKLRELFGEVPDTGQDTARDAFRRACEHYAATAGIDWRDVKNYVEKMHARKLAADNRRAGRPKGAE